MMDAKTRYELLEMVDEMSAGGPRYLELSSDACAALATAIRIHCLGLAELSYQLDQKFVPKLNIKDSNLDSDAIQAWNEWGIAVESYGRIRGKNDAGTQ